MRIALALAAALAAAPTLAAAAVLTSAAVDACEAHLSASVTTPDDHTEAAPKSKLTFAKPVVTRQGKDVKVSWADGGVKDVGGKRHSASCVVSGETGKVASALIDNKPAEP
jgi:hypothetical protein